jgi:PDZ domain
MQSSRPRSIAQRPFEYWPWAAGVGAGALLIWIGSCALCADSGDLAHTQPSPAQPSDRPTSESGAEIAALRMALDREVEAREQLAREVASLREQIDSDTTPGRESDASAPAPDRDAQRSRFDAGSLIAAGMASADAQELRSRWESTELDKIRLIDRATREGWLGTAQYQQQMQALEGDLRAGLSEADYDRYLYATGRNNRARITDVLANSPGEAAGLRAGDTILSYGGKRVFSIEELRELATTSRPGESIPVEALQDGAVVRLFVPGGPIGVMLEPEHQAPR